MRNPLTAALAAMALHAGASVAFGWPYPSVATFLAGILAVPWALARRPPPAGVIGACGGLAILAPTAVPLGLVLACLAALAGARAPGGDDPFRNVAVALPALAALVLLLTL